ncbi:VOC family protein [Mucilaginibacter mali]|uniref:VOC family protein n=1 Tax=Mucilaginibacter mali TaxID=2740462 RepID=A0A7D4TX79_9SPHI|nr:VOC family protein [Mucilaginibacter mali]QKJ32135.1 VOC family protein [Mucilaginibacter mali]
MKQPTAFAPVLAVKNGTYDIDFYKNAFGAVETMRINNDDGSMHVAEFMIDDALFHLHEITQFSNTVTPLNAHGGTVTIGLLVDDVHAVFDRAVAAGATPTMPVTDFEYGWRQGEFIDPFGHKWTIERKL